MTGLDTPDAASHRASLAAALATGLDAGGELGPPAVFPE